MQEMQADPRDILFSYAAMVLGALGISVALFALFAGPFTPQPDVGTQIGEIAGNMRAAAERALLGTPQPEETIVHPTWDIDRILMAAAPILGVLGVIASVIAFIRREPMRMATYGLLVSMASIFMQVVLIVALIIAGAMILIGIMQNLDSILGG